MLTRQYNYLFMLRISMKNKERLYIYATHCIFQHREVTMTLHGEITPFTFVKMILHTLCSGHHKIWQFIEGFSLARSRGRDR